LSTFSHSKSNKSSNISLPSSNDSNLYLSNGRILNGVEEKFTLPKPMEILNNTFFESFTTKPSDFDEKTALYFKAGF